MHLTGTHRRWDHGGGHETTIPIDESVAAAQADAEDAGWRALPLDSITRIQTDGQPSPQDLEALFNSLSIAEADADDRWLEWADTLDHHADPSTGEAPESPLIWVDDRLYLNIGPTSGCGQELAWVHISDSGNVGEYYDLEIVAYASIYNDYGGSPRAESHLTRSTNGRFIVFDFDGEGGEKVEVLPTRSNRESLAEQFSAESSFGSSIGLAETVTSLIAANEATFHQEPGPGDDWESNLEITIEIDLEHFRPMGDLPPEPG